MSQQEPDRGDPIHDPIHEHANGTWFFWSEVWADEYGPYASREEAAAALEEYCRILLEGG